MLNQSSGLDLTFAALADPARRAMIERLARGPASVTELAQPLAISLPAVLQHVAVLQASELIYSSKIGRVRTCRINPSTLVLLEQWVRARRRQWSAKLDRPVESLWSLD